MGAVILNEDMLLSAEKMHGEVIELIKTMCAIPAPSHHEELRAEFVRSWFAARGMEAEIDSAKNVRVPLGLDDHEDIVVIMAHTDTVFPDMEPMPLYEKEGRIYCPGVGDNTTNLAAMMVIADYVRQYMPKCGVLFVADACEEGLGNLKGCRAIMEAYGEKVKAFIALDGGYDEVCAQAVGSARYRITAKTCGGHSFADFGNRNAIEVLAALTCAIYAQDVSDLPAGKTTYNVGSISGGTSVNTIAQEAHMLYEYRSDNAACLEIMEHRLQKILKEHTPQDAQVKAELLGLRPCAKDVDLNAQHELNALCQSAILRYTAKDAELRSGSTDCNIPLSLGIPAVCFGVYEGKGAHTREEWIDTASVLPGIKIALSVILNWFHLE